jgi:NADH-quinone oxidoreductase subunit M
MVLLGTIHVSGWMTFCLATSMVLGAVYMLYLTRRIIFGKMLNADLSGIQDITLREKVTLIPLAVLVVFLGVYPKPLLKMTQPAVDMIVKEYAPTPQPQVTRAKE